MPIYNIQMKLVKKCACGKIHTKTPIGAKFHDDGPDSPYSGIYFECECKSTLFVPLRPVKEEIIPDYTFNWQGTK